MAKFHDSRLETRVETEIKEKFSVLAKDNHMTPSELNRALIIQFVMGKIELQPFGAADSSTWEASKAS